MATSGTEQDTRGVPLREALRRTTMIESLRLRTSLAINVTIASETFQHTGSFKFRAAYNLARTVPNDLLITASSGNFGQALAYAATMLSKRSIIVMPDNSAQVKVAAVREFGGIVEMVTTTVKSRAARVRELADEHPDAYVASAYDDPLVIEGNATLGVELAAYDFDVITVPIGGGGLSSGLIKGLRGAGSKTRVVGVEPAIANDAARSLKSGAIEVNSAEPQTIADGVRTVSVGKHNWAILKDELHSIIEVSEDNIKDATRKLMWLANLKAEPTGGVALAALLANPDMFTGQNVCCIVSGGNVDPEVLKEILG